MAAKGNGRWDGTRVLEMDMGEPLHLRVGGEGDELWLEVECGEAKVRPITFTSLGEVHLSIQDLQKFMARRLR